MSSSKTAVSSDENTGSPGEPLRFLHRKAQAHRRRLGIVLGAAWLVGTAITLSGCAQQAINAADNKPLSAYDGRIAKFQWPELSPSARQAKWNALDEDDQDNIERRYHAQLLLQKPPPELALKALREGGGNGGGGGGGGGGD